MRLVARSAAIAAFAVSTSIVAAPRAIADVVYRVDSTADAVDANPGDGVCRAADGRCTLRAAVQEANADSGPVTIAVPAGRFVMTIPPAGEAGTAAKLDASNGSLDITGDVKINGAGAPETVVDGGGLDRVFTVQSGASARLSDMTITHGDSTGAGTSQEIDLGGGILNMGSILLERVALVDNLADGGGGMFSIPGTSPIIRDTLIARNRAYSGGGLRLDAGETIVNTTITANTLLTLPPGAIEHKPVAIVVPLVDEISGWGGGIDNRGGGDVTIVNSTVTGNHALKGGGGLASGQGYAPVSDKIALGRMTLRNTIVAWNTSDAGPQNCHVKDQIIASLGHNIDTDGSCFLTGQGDLPRTDPLLAPLADNGGPTWTQALRPGSPAIDAGAAEGCPDHDARGVPRPQGRACDIGAYELVPARTSAQNGRPAPRRCQAAVRLPERWRARVRRFDVLIGRAVLVRHAPPDRVVRIAVQPNTRSIVLRARLRRGGTVRITVAIRPSCH